MPTLAASIAGSDTLRLPQAKSFQPFFPQFHISDYRYFGAQLKIVPTLNTRIELGWEHIFNRDLMSKLKYEFSFQIAFYQTPKSFAFSSMNVMVKCFHVFFRNYSGSHFQSSC